MLWSGRTSSVSGVSLACLRLLSVSGASCCAEKFFFLFSLAEEAAGAAAKSDFDLVDIMICARVIVWDMEVT